MTTFKQIHANQRNALGSSAIWSLGPAPDIGEEECWLKSALSLLNESLVLCTPHRGREAFRLNEPDFSQKRRIEAA